MIQAHNDAALAALKAAWPGGRIYTAGSVPTSPATPYQVVSVDTGAAVNYRAVSVATSTTFRIAVQVIGATYNEAAAAADKADVALAGKRLAVTGRATTPCRREVSTSLLRDPDGGSSMYGLLTYTFTSSPAS